MKNITAVFVILFLISSSTVFAAKPVSPGKNKDFNPVPNSVCIDSGHGGSDIGAVNNDLLEKDVNLQAALLLKANLEAADYTVFMTRTEDIYLTNANRYNYCDAQRAAILISIHHNGSTNSSTDYTSALYMKKKDVSLATVVAGTVSTSLGLPNYGISRFPSGLLIKSDMPATISEAFFLTSSTEYDLIKNGDRLEQEADALFNAVTAYFATNP